MTSSKSFAMQHRPSYAKDSDQILYNWSGLQYIADKSKVVHPSNEHEIAQVMERARKVRIIGTALSYEPISSLGARGTETSSTSPKRSSSTFRCPSSSSSTSPPQLTEDDTAVISLQQDFVGLIAINLEKNTAMFHAATSIDEVIHVLARHGQMMTACPGVIGIQTLAGSISTGTHGQGLYQSDYADMVQSFRIILTDGTIQTMTPTDPMFYLYLISVGTFGLITEIEISIRPRLLFTCTKFSCTYDIFIQNYVKWNQNSEFCKVWWFPKTEMCQVWLVNPSNEQEVAYYHEHKPRIPRQLNHHRQHSTNPDDETTITVPHLDDAEPVEFPSNETHTLMNQTVHDYIQAMAKDTQVSQTSGEPQFRTLTRFMNMQTVIGWNEQLVTKGIPVPQINCEISIPLEKSQAATEALRRWNDENSGKLHYPFIYHVAGRSKALMSASHRGPVVWIGFLVYISQSGSIRDDGMTTMYQLQRVLAPFDGLPHWGKHFHPELFAMSKHYTLPVWNKFKQEMRRIDPLGKLTSPFLQNIFFGPAPYTNVVKGRL